MAYQLADAQLLISEANKQGANWPTTLNFQYGVLAWLRQENGPRSNPLGLFQGGKMTVFPSTQAAFAASAHNLISNPRAKAYGYTAVVEAGRTGDPIAFLNALNRSSWSGTRYGLRQGKNNLISVYNRLTGSKVSTAVSSSGGHSVGGSWDNKSPSNTLSDWQKQLQSIGISTDPNHVITQEEAQKIASNLYHTSGGLATDIINSFAGKKVGEASKAQNVNFDPIGIIGSIGESVPNAITFLGFLMLGVVIILGGIILLASTSKKESE